MCVVQHFSAGKTTARPPPLLSLQQALREPLRMMLAVLNFKDDTLEQVIDRVLDMERGQNNIRMSMVTL